MKPATLYFATLILSIPALGSAKDLGIYNGEPTPALAMYAAQTAFAANTCVSTGLVTDAKGAASFSKYFGRGIQLSLYAKDEDFAANYSALLARYSEAWSAAPEESKRKFCEDFNREIAVKGEGFFKWFGPMLYFRAKFSPISEASAASQRKAAVIASVAGAVLTSAATIASAHDSVSSAKAGNWAVSNQQMAMSRNFNQLGSAMVTTAQAPQRQEPGPLISVLEVEAADGVASIVRCPVVDHFFSFTAPADSPVWTTYQRVSMPCRDPLPADLARMN